MDITSLCAGPPPSAEELAVIAEFVRATNAGELAALQALFTADAQVNDQLRNFWGMEEIASWLAAEIVGERVELKLLRIKKHYEVVIAAAEIRGEFEAAPTAQPMTIDLNFTVQRSMIVRLLILLARDDASEPELRRMA